MQNISDEKLTLEMWAQKCLPKLTEIQRAMVYSPELIVHVHCAKCKKQVPKIQVEKGKHPDRSYLFTSFCHGEKEIHEILFSDLEAFISGGEVFVEGKEC